MMASSVVWKGDLCSPLLPWEELSRGSCKWKLLLFLSSFRSCLTLGEVVVSFSHFQGGLNAWYEGWGRREREKKSEIQILYILPFSRPGAH
jgi:hypothetical protein